MTTMRLTLVCGLVIMFAACSAKPPSEKTSSESSGPKGAAVKLTSTEYKALSPTQKYQVANKLMATFFKGVQASEFFDLTAGTSDDQLEVTAAGNTFVDDTASAITTRLDNPGAFHDHITNRYTLDATRGITAEALAIVHEYPVSRDMFEAWMAYVLANTILFSPAEEIDSADYTDVSNVYSNLLIGGFKANKTVNQIVYEHMNSESNWRRFRSPEDNTREMIEIYLGLFDRDADVPKASIACKNWYLTGENAGYQLQKGLDVNTEPQRVLDQYVTTCEDFYKVVAESPLVIPRVITVLVDHFFPAQSSETRADLVKSIAASKPTTFHQIFTAIVFSKLYLLNNDRPYSLEEAFFNVADRLNWQPGAGFYSDLTNPAADPNRPSLLQMKQPTMSLKLGRFSEQPLDSLSFAYYHQLMREYLLIKSRDGSAFSTTDQGWNDDILRAGDFLIGNEYINYLFLSVVGRTATQSELDVINAAIEANALQDTSKVGQAYQDARKGQASLVFDYLSRLPELYYAKAVQ